MNLFWKTGMNTRCEVFAYPRISPGVHNTALSFIARPVGWLEEGDVRSRIYQDIEGATLLWTMRNDRP